MDRYFGIIMLFLVIGFGYFMFTQVLSGEKLGDLISPFSLGKLFQAQSQKTVPISRPQVSSPETPKKEVPVPPPGFSVSQLSPDYQKIKLGSVSLAGNFGGMSQFTLRTNFSGSEKINVTGWRVRTNKGNFLTIPKAITDYRPSGRGSPIDIVLGANEYINFYSGKSATGESFRLNQCMGYLNSAYQFNPSLPGGCPSLYDRREIVSFSGGCQNFIMSLGSCETPDMGKLTTAISPDDYLCRPFLDQFNYRGCYEENYQNSNFFSNEWRVWLDNKFPFDQSHDRLLLFDEAGLLVDEYFY